MDYFGNLLCGLPVIWSSCFPHLFAFFSKLCCYAKLASQQEWFSFGCCCWLSCTLRLLSRLVSYHIYLLLSHKAVAVLSGNAIVLFNGFLLLSLVEVNSWKWLLTLLNLMLLTNEINSLLKGVSSFTCLGELKVFSP